MPKKRRQPRLMLFLDLDFVDDRDEDADVPNTPNSTV